MSVNNAENQLSNKLFRDIALLKRQMIELRKATLRDIYSVGDIHISANDTNPSEKFGGTWVAFGTGRTLVGIDTGDADFNTIKEMGGAKTHFHWQTSGSDNGTSYMEVNGAGSGHTSVITADRVLIGNTGRATTGTRRDGTYDSSNMPPYITVYMWEKTA